MVRIGVVDLAEARPFRRRKFKAEETPAALQHAMRFPQGGRNVGHVPYAEGDRIGIEHAVGKAQPFGIFLCPDQPRSEEHTSELQSLMRISYAVFCLKKKNTTTIHIN